LYFSGITFSAGRQTALLFCLPVCLLVYPSVHHRERQAPLVKSDNLINTSQYLANDVRYDVS